MEQLSANKTAYYEQCQVQPPFSEKNCPSANLGDGQQQRRIELDTSRIARLPNLLDSGNRLATWSGRSFSFNESTASRIFI
jgi:hypothetical protein